MNAPRDSIETLRNLIAFDSVSSNSNEAISAWVRDQLCSLGFDVESTSYLDDKGISKHNLVAQRDPISSSESGGVAYFCHTDVVPAIGWTGPGGDPFTAVVTDDRIFGRGSCDMKGSLAAMMAAVSRIPVQQQMAPLWIVCTADEELAFKGAKHIVAQSDAYQRIVQAQPLGIIGEPTRLSVVHAHKGITGFRIISHGRAAHSSGTDGVNAVEAMVPMLDKLLEIGEKTNTDPEYHDERFDPPVLSWNFGVHDHGAAVNVTPARCTAWVTLRPMPNIDGEDLIDQAKQTAASLGLEFKRFEGGGPVWIDPNSACIGALCEVVGGQSKTVCYGTDGGEFADLRQLAVLGPGDVAQAHTTDEFIEIEQLNKGVEIYQRVIERWACS